MGKKYDSITPITPMVLLGKTKAMWKLRQKTEKTEVYHPHVRLHPARSESIRCKGIPLFDLQKLNIEDQL
jgi:hypothetical protein